MANSFTMKAEGSEDIARQMAALIKAGQDTAPLMADFGVHLESTTIERFDTQTAPDGTGWTPSKRAKEQRAKEQGAKEQGGKTLTDKGIMKSSVTNRSGNDYVMVGSNLKYFGVHDQGYSGNVTVPEHVRTTSMVFGRALAGPISFKVGSFTRAMQMPQRQILGLSQENKDEFGALAEDHFGRAAPGMVR